MFCLARLCPCPAALRFLRYQRINVGVGQLEERRLLTGVHTVADIYCNVCNNVLGWKYVSTYRFMLP